MRALLSIGLVIVVDILLVACTKSAPAVAADEVDCKLIDGDRANALVNLSTKYPGAPMKVAEIIEHCIAPDGDPCDRIGKIAKAIPSMMANGTTGPSDPTTTCRGAPPEMQRCFLPSYVLGHQSECSKMFSEMADLNLETREPLPATAGVPQDCKDLAIELTTNQIRFDREAMRPLPRTASGIDAAALTLALRPFRAKCAGAATLKVADDVVWQDVIVVMDEAIKAGFTNISFEDGVDVPARPSRPPGDLGAEVTRAIVVISTTQILINGKEIAAGDIAAGTEAALKTAKPTTQLIVQADRATVARRIKQVIVGARRAGIDNVLFAVKNK